MFKNKYYSMFHAVVIILTFFIMNQYFKDLNIIIGLAIVFVVELVLQVIENLFFNKEDHEKRKNKEISGLDKKEN